jgi:hypothetical protein
VRNLWTFKTPNFAIALDCGTEWAPDFSWCDEETVEALNSGALECVIFRVTVSDRRGMVLGADWLGNSIYADVAEFRREHVGAAGRWGSYFPDMVRNAIREARAELRRLQAVPVRKAA